ncbi:MAG: 7-cyano-7-deazaguanine synthase [Thermodesulfovibrionia bacterium]|nr:7-cyano-7-deazaguanine synthase [Thermodesulfovibrionia bacterium]
MTKAVALYSGGLDSTLAVLVMQRQGIEVTAITFLNHFGCDISDRSSCSKDPFAASEKFGFKVKLSHLSEKFLDIVKNPKYGHGKNMNPCLDCRILMLKEAKELMKILGADFLITGEVLGQRPMSQRKDCFPMIDKAADVKGLVVRPLSGKLLPATIPEEKGLVNRDLFYDFNGRTRKPQIALAEEFGLTEYPAPAGGCLLTEPVYAYKLKDLLEHNKDPEYKDINFLRVGRHFRFSPDCKIVVGRNKEENNTIRSLADPDDHILKVEEFGSPTTVILGIATDEAISIAASLCARYSDAKKLTSVNVAITKNKQKYYLNVKPAGDEILEQYRIEKKGTTLSRLNLHIKA